MSSCLTSDELRQFLSGTLLPSEERIISDHVETCTHCQSVLDNWIEADNPIAQRTRRPTEATFLRQLKSLDVAMIRSSSRMSSPVEGASELPMIPGYEILGELGRGGTSIVYRARHLRLRREVAIKMLPSATHLSESDRHRLRLEAETVAQLQHPNIVQLYEIGEIGARSYLVFEYVAGGTLQQRLAGKPQPPIAAAELVETLARTVHVAHRARIIHRDLKPANVLLSDGPGSSYGFPKLTDFGLAKRLDAHSVALTRSLSGTPAYMAPEQITGEETDKQRSITAATDVYALGVILYEMLTGRPPFLSPDWMATLLQVERSEPVPPRALQPGTPRDLETICLKCLRKDPMRRYTSAEDLADDLRRFQKGEPIRARPIGRFERAGRWVRNYPFLTATMVFAIFATIAAMTALSVSLSVEREKSEAEKLARQRETQLRADAERNVYFSRISQANLQWRDNDVAGARNSLTNCPPEFRNWEWYYLHGLVNDGLLALSVPSDHVIEDLAVNSRWIAAVVAPRRVRSGRSDSGLLLLWDARDGRELVRRTLPSSGQQGKVAFSPDGRRLVTLGSLDSGEPGRAKSSVGSVWDLGPLADGIGALGHPEFVIPAGLMGTRYQLSANARWLAAESAEHANEVLFWDLQKGDRPIHRFSNLAEPIKCVTLSSDGTLIATCLDNGERWIWETTTGNVFGHWSGVPVTEMGISPNNRELTAYEGIVRLAVRDPLNGKMLKELTSSMGGELIYSEDSRFLLIRRPDLIRCWDRTVNQRIPLAETSGDRERGSVAVAVSPECVTAATGSVDGAIRLWNLQAGALWQDDLDIYRSHSARIRALAFSPEGRRLVSGGEDGVIRVWDLTRPQRYRVVHQEDNVATPAIFFAANDRRIGSVHGNRLCWADAVMGHRLAEHTLTASADECSSSAINAAATRLVIAGSTADVHLFDLDQAGTPRLRQVFRSSPGTQRLLAQSADGRRIATGVVHGQDRSGELFVWNAETRELLHHETRANWDLQALALSPDGHRIALATDRQVQILILRENGLESQAQMDVPDVTLQALAFSPGGEYLAAVGGPIGNTFLWTMDGRMVWSATAGGQPLGLVYHPDGTRLGVLTKTGEITLWDVATGVEAFRVHGPRNFDAGHSPVAMGLCFSQQGRCLATADGQSKLFIWETFGEANQRREELRIAADSRALEWHKARREVCKLYRYADEFHQKQIGVLLGPRE